MEFILPLIISVVIAPFVGFGCMMLIVVSLIAFRAHKKLALFKEIGFIALGIFMASTWAAPIPTFLTIVALIDHAHKTSVASKRLVAQEFWKSFATIEQDLYKVKSEEDPAYQKLKATLQNYVPPCRLIIGPLHDDGVRELAIQPLYDKRHRLISDDHKKIDVAELLTFSDKDEFQNWLIGYGFNDPQNLESAPNDSKTDTRKIFAKDILYQAKRNENHIDVDIYTDIDVNPAKQTNQPRAYSQPVREFLERNLGGQYYDLLVGEVRYHPMAQGKAIKAKTIDSIHQSFRGLLSPAERQDFEANITNRICVGKLPPANDVWYCHNKNPYVQPVVAK